MLKALILYVIYKNTESDLEKNHKGNNSDSNEILTAIREVLENFPRHLPRSQLLKRNNTLIESIKHVTLSL